LPLLRRTDAHKKRHELEQKKRALDTEIRQAEGNFEAEEAQYRFRFPRERLDTLYGKFGLSLPSGAYELMKREREQLIERVMGREEG
jgi:hypothetical protein